MLHSKLISLLVPRRLCPLTWKLTFTDTIKSARMSFQDQNYKALEFLGELR